VHINYSLFLFVFVISLLLSLVTFHPQTIVGSKLIGSQTKDTPVDDFIQCLGNLLAYPTICVGTKHDDKMNGVFASETIYGKKGNDEIQAQAGNDIVYAGKGDDTIQGAEGSDIIFGEDGNDFLYGDSGSNFLTGGGGNTLYGGDGDDHLFGGPDNDVFTGGPGKNFFDCNEGQDRITDFDESRDTATQNCEFIEKL
jgi:Ca2+-binding RTX toxin-like protein